MDDDTRTYDRDHGADAQGRWSLDALAPLFERLIPAAPEGVSEWALAMALGAAEPGLRLPRGDLAAQFRYHLALFRALYRWDDRLRRRGEALIVDPLAIRRYRLAPGVPEAADPLRAFYLASAPETVVDLDEVSRLIASLQKRRRMQARLAEAYALMGLTPEAGPGAARRAYRRLSMRHHPDRGGEDAMHARLSEAWRIIRRCG